MMVDRVVTIQGVEAVLFDLDGTLIDSAPDLGGAVNQMRADRHMPLLPLSTYRPWVGTGARGMLTIAFGLTPEDADFETLKEEFFVNYEARLSRDTAAFDGVHELIHRLNGAGIPWGVVTNKSKRFTVPLTSAMPVFASAGTIVSGDTTAYSKPHPAPLLLAAEQLNIEADKCLYVGDDARDIQAGKAAGMKTVAAAYGYLGPGVDHTAWLADATIHSPLDLATLLGLRNLA